MKVPESIIWVASIDPDSSEEAILLALQNRALRICHSISEAQTYLVDEPADLLFANFPVADGTPTELLACVNSMPRPVPVFVRNPASSIDDAMCLARMGAAHLFGGDTEVEEIVHRVDLLLAEVRKRDRALNVCEQASYCSPQAGLPSWKRSLVGRSRSMEQVGQLIQLVAARRCTILVTGETGTGKEVVARAIHTASPRAANPFVAVNCSALPENLLEAELFGHVKGAFTGAQQLRIGRFEQANRGTLFLDEVGDMPLEVQTKLLRVLQEREFERLGSSETIQVDVRIIAATNVDLREMVRQGKFRQDLYYRLNVVPVQMPPLRSRLSDIPALVEHFLERICRDEGLSLKQVDAGAIESLMERQWPGNVRQLENAVEMAVVLSGVRRTLVAGDFPYNEGLQLMELATTAPPLSVPDHGLDFDQTVFEFERNILTQALQRTHGNKKQAAEMLGLKRTTLSAKVRVLEAAAGSRK